MDPSSPGIQEHRPLRPHPQAHHEVHPCFPQMTQEGGVRNLPVHDDGSDANQNSCPEVSTRAVDVPPRGVYNTGRPLATTSRRPEQQP